MNKLALVQQLHLRVHNVPARVVDGTLKPAPVMNEALINPRYVGAELTSVLY